MASEFDKLLLSNLEAINKKLDAMNERFNNLPCAANNVRLSLLEQKETDRKDNKNFMRACGLAALGAFGLSLWNWFKGA